MEAGGTESRSAALLLVRGGGQHVPALDGQRLVIDVELRSAHRCRLGRPYG